VTGAFVFRSALLPPRPNAQHRRLHVEQEPAARIDVRHRVFATDVPAIRRDARAALRTPDRAEAAGLHWSRGRDGERTRHTGHRVPRHFFAAAFRRRDSTRFRATSCRSSGVFDAHMRLLTVDLFSGVIGGSFIAPSARFRSSAFGEVDHTNLLAHDRHRHGPRRCFTRAGLLKF